MTDEEKKAAADAEKGKGEQSKSDAVKELAELKAKNAELETKIKEYSKEKSKDDDDLNQKAKLKSEADKKKAGDSKALERAITFNLQSKEFLKVNESLLPKDVSEIFSLAEKENYADAIEKDSAIKAGIIQSFFGVQANVDLLTPSQKSSLDDYLKLTKTMKQEHAQSKYDSLFEPTFEMLKRIKKAEAVSRGHVFEGDADLAYKKKMMDLSRKHYLGEK